MIKVVELFAGIGAPRKALTNLGIEHESIISEFDKHAVKAYNGIHGETVNMGDIRKIERLPECDLLCYGFPCQDISNAGHGRGLKEGSGTRSSLLWEVDRLMDVSPLPKVLFMENVPDLTYSVHVRDFNRYIRTLADRGYTVSYALLNSCDYGIPQNRLRLFMVACLDGRLFEFPKAIPLAWSLGDMLEDDVVDEKYYLTPEQVAKYEAHRVRNHEANRGFGWDPTDGEDDIAKGITTKPERHCSTFIKVAGSLNTGYDKMDRVYDPEGIAPCVDTCQGGNRHIKIKEATAKGYAEAEEGDGITLKYPNGNVVRGRVQKGMTSTLLSTGGQAVVVRPTMTPRLYDKEQNGRTVKDDGDPMYAITATNPHGVEIEDQDGLRIRVLTERERQGGVWGSQTATMIRSWSRESPARRCIRCTVTASWYRWRRRSSASCTSRLKKPSGVCVSRSTIE